MRGTTTRPRDVLAPAFAPLPPKRELKTHHGGGGGATVNGTSDGPGAVARRRRCHVEATGPRGAPERGFAVVLLSGHAVSSRPSHRILRVITRVIVFSGPLIEFC